MHCSVRWLLVLVLLGVSPVRASVTAEAFSYEVSQVQTALTSALVNIQRHGPGAPGTSAATAAAAQGSLQCLAQMTGCGFEFNLFQQPCNDSRANASLTDTLQILGVPNGTFVQVRVNYEIQGFVDGIGGYYYQAGAHLNGVGNAFAGSTGGTVLTHTNVSIADSRTWTVNLNAPANVLLTSTLNTQVLNRWCAGGSADCVPSATAWTKTLLASTTVRLEVLTPGLEGIQIVGRNGHDYLTHPVSVTDGAGTRPRLAAWPNPSRGAVNLSLELAEATNVDVGVFDVAGRRVATVHRGPLPSGARSLTWDGRDAEGREARGVFFLRASGPGASLAQRVLVLR